MADIEPQIQEGVQKALKEKEDKDRFAARFGWALLFGALSGYVVWSKFWIFSLYDNMLFWAIGIGAVVGFFISELLAIAAIALIAFAGYTWFQGKVAEQKIDLSRNYSLCVRNSLDKEVQVTVITGFKAKDGEFRGQSTYEFSLKANGYTRLKGENDVHSFGGVYSVKVDNGRYVLDPEHWIQLDDDSVIAISSSGIMVRHDPDCVKP